MDSAFTRLEASLNKRGVAVEYFVKALSTGERSAAQRLEALLAEDVEYDTNTQPGAVPIGREVFKGRKQVLDRIFGLWPATPGYARVGWSEPEPEGDKLKVITSGTVSVIFSFNDRDEISHVVLEGGYGSRGASAYQTPNGPVQEIPLIVKGMVNNALANQTPIVVTYVDDQGAPHSSLRGSVCVFSPTQLAIWVRHADGGLPQAIVKNPRISIAYSDRRANANVFMMGYGHIESDDESRRKAYELCPEVEQTHDPDRHGVALIIDVVRMQANAGPGRGTFTLARE